MASWDHDGQPLRRSHALALVVSLLLVLVVALALHTPTASAATYTASCPTAEEVCAALAERLEVIVDLLAAEPPPAEPISGTVALASDDRSRLDTIALTIAACFGLGACVYALSFIRNAWPRA